MIQLQRTLRSFKLGFILSVIASVVKRQLKIYVASADIIADMITQKLNIALIPSQEVSRSAIAYSEKLSAKGTRFTLKEGSLYPHVSLFMLEVPVEDIGRVVEATRVLAKNNVSPVLSPRKYVIPGQSYYDLEYERSDQLDGLQSELVATVSPLRASSQEPARLFDTPQQEQSYKSTGYPFAGAAFRPHITLTRFSGDVTTPPVGKPGLEEFACKAPSIGVFKKGDHGTCTELVASFEFS